MNYIMRKRLKLYTSIALVTCIFLFVHNSQTYCQTAGKNHALLIGGIGGEERYSQKFFSYLKNTYDTFINNFNFSPENIRVLAEPAFQNEPFINGISSESNIKESFNFFSGILTADDDIYIILFGHGNYDGKNSKLNIPRRDLTDKEYAEMVDLLPARRIIFINTASSSFPFIKQISKSGRIIITATSSPTQRNFTVFPEFFIKGLSDTGADIDKNEKISVLELFTYAVHNINRFYKDDDHLATEFAILEDTGDSKGYRLHELQQWREGALAEVTYLNRNILDVSKTSQKDSVVINLIKEQEKLELEIAKLKRDKSKYNETDYYNKLEELLVKLAQVSENIEKHK